MSLESDTVQGYRFVTDDLKSEHGTVQWEIGEWQYIDGELELCENGFHASEDPLDNLNYVFGSRWFRCEARGKILRDSDKFCASEMRLTEEIPEKTLRQFAYECAKHVLPIFEKQYPNDNRPRKCLEAAKAYLDAPTEENRGKIIAAGDAARDAGAAAGAAAWAAGAAAWAARDAGAAAGAAARDAVWAAAWAAGDAVWAAAWAARYARAAAWDAWAAGAAGDAEKEWQQNLLRKLLEEATQ